MKKTQEYRRAFLDKLEKKYLKKVQLQAFERESDLLKSQLATLSGRKVRQLESRSYKLTYLS